ncbi:glycosyltransferase [Mesorhizobium sp. M1C.F.Ca.ET.193.01.1.1]|uniref:glycosyltransferase family 2 protein n=1 Tax=unclassified Mesorhizobium TaxID=325217 RepID=UPI000FD546CA|nr:MULTISPECIES: glycosyltransferase [unclassified Mesorhizobium]TGS93318.1 glycosyltransferase [bacterium M00.F.Ca.ET.177.01.1.1]TGQ50595.1 glycosyltransferase [Mesorhizobium sp. M1C.F.Ca.ET.210.01.1.1]TGQ65766.1 glycosyltransferase [Mesorhizobium sp. M1C.F.Ca.ET.212.01.1.1]TGQ99711.1 glycosyltransferase [Mesorhizobium sp. M1C.F.Ca.ET.204.01.1.1]TGR20127.1 glycosyltransferase [Mesorhizobium sp. M1C.F.Ca.ET.196.01.1.1]
MASAPLISVLLPVYNAEPYVAAAIQSILRQDHGRLEVIAIDDGSTDRSLEILERHRRDDSRVSIISRENRGLVASLNEGLRMAQGELVARMDADDFAYPWRLSRQAALFAAQPELGFCGSLVDVLVHGRIARGRLDPVFRLSLPVLAKFFTIFMHPTVVYNRRVIGEADLYYDAAYRHAEDFDLFRRLADRYPAALVEESLLVYRVHPGSVTSRHVGEMRRTHLRIVGENLEREGLAEDTSDLRAIGDAVSLETVRRVAGFIRALEERIAALPADMRPSFAAGALNLFYFLYQLVNDEERPALTHELLTATAKWNAIRRREKYALSPGAWAPWLSQASMWAGKRADRMAYRFKSAPAASVLAPYRVGAA